MRPRRLVLLRHAKSDWPAGVEDHERPLARRGRRDAPAAGRWLRDNGLVPDLAVVSSAVRTQQTWELVEQQLGRPVPARLDDDVYAAPAGDLLEVVRSAPAEVRTLLLVGHNPGIWQLASVLDDGSGDLAAAAALREKFPTSALAVLDVPGDWHELDPERARLTQVAVPRG